jgi:PAS domain S-box-containing protein
VEADFDFAPVQADINRRGAQTLAAGAVTVLAVTAIIAAFMWFAVGRPLGALVKNMKRIAAGRHNLQLAVHSNDEIGEVARTFNTMAARLDEKEDSLKKTRDYLLGIVENSSDIIITVGPYERIETFNRGAERILGYSRREAVGRDWKTLFLNEDELRAFSAEADSQPRVEGFEAALRHKSGESVTVLLTESRLWGNGGKTIGKILIAVDITKYKEVQKQLIQHERLAALGTAVAKIHHSSKNILNAFKGGSYMVNTALKKGDGALLKEGWEIIESAIARISSVTQDMLDFSRAGGLNIQPGALAPLAQEVIWSVKGAAREHNVTIVSQFPDSIPAVAFDHKVIHTALMNLIANAMDACRFKDYPPGHGGEIVVRLRESADRRFVRLEVQDNGGGVETKDLERIFTPFFSTKYSEGNGLGLPITLKAARDHGGDLEVQSIEGQGSTFTLSLPVCNGARAESKHSPGRTAGSAL